MSQARSAKKNISKYVEEIDIISSTWMEQCPHLFRADNRPGGYLGKNTKDNVMLTSDQSAPECSFSIFPEDLSLEEWKLRVEKALDDGSI